MRLPIANNHDRRRPQFHPRVRVNHHHPRHHHQRPTTTTKVEAKVMQEQRLRISQNQRARLHQSQRQKLVTSRLTGLLRLIRILLPHLQLRLKKLPCILLKALSSNLIILHSHSTRPSYLLSTRHQQQMSLESLPPILDTGATHCLLPLSWLSPEEASSSKRIHLKVASGTSVRALLYNNVIYCSTVSRPLISVGQLKAMLDLRFHWDDSSPTLLVCSGGLKYILLEALLYITFR